MTTKQQKQLSVIDHLQVASPCDADWEQMVGDDTKRHCTHCRKDVYDLTKMSDVDIRALVRATSGSFCGRLWQRRDGKVLREDCPVGLRSKLVRGVRASRRLAYLVLASLFSAATFGCRDQSNHVAPGDDFAPQPTAADLIGDSTAEASKVASNSLQRFAEAIQGGLENAHNQQRLKKSRKTKTAKRTRRKRKPKLDIFGSIDGTSLDDEMIMGGVDAHVGNGALDNMWSEELFPVPDKYKK